MTRRPTAGHRAGGIAAARRADAAAYPARRAGTRRLADRPAAQRLGDLVAELRWWHRAQREPIVPGLPDDLPPDLAAELLAGTVDWDDPRPALERLVATVPGVLSAVENGHYLVKIEHDGDVKERDLSLTGAQGQLTVSADFKPKDGN